ncbi:enoyl Coenzyme A hydratase domain containing 3 [Gaeumannomyces tritici R3-111a-1]|uniref:Enoyl-CoA hydratase domain-containing protein 3, mitochondrial n=1 Tax=Gaeumannomyces tritici (strain R3-111a-1) TaxID=644352 RepID=J3P6D1_GAET3|nr:enoyl Coenzyme A hydratase domain containing 3 [Gaeumannomyces tritici R3-111a-1]EJT72205.1 enoyl Coenzyme A hydratase domain containing 3 [Gaeumannomyces tritici R3-111a-1]
MLPELPAKAAYILINNPARRNALCLATLRDLRDQLTRALTSPLTGRPLLLPPFRPQLLPAFERAAGLPPKPWPEGPDSTAKKRKKRKKKMQKQAPNTTATTTDEDDDPTWLVDPAAWNHHRAGLPSVLVLRSSVPSSRVFSSGHDLRELSTLSPDDVRATFALCADVMSLLRRSPAPVVCAVEGLATAAGMQLALTADLVVGMGDGGGGGYEGAARWAGRVMAVHATSAEAREGVAAFLDKRSPAWTVKEKKNYGGSPVRGTMFPGPRATQAQASPSRRALAGTVLHKRKCLLR